VEHGFRFIVLPILLREQQEKMVMEVGPNIGIDC
jgi:hypothetical protein